MELLIERMYQVALGIISLKTFECWLYRQALAVHMDDEFILEVFSFNYNQKRACRTFLHHFRSLFTTPHYNEWKIGIYLNQLAGRKEPSEEILHEINYTLSEEYPFLTNHGYFYYAFAEDNMMPSHSQEALQEDIRSEAADLLAQLQEALIPNPGMHMRDFEPGPVQKEEHPEPAAPVKVPAPTHPWWKICK
ncbi:hypothetical protein AB9P05_19190 [Roseivirga sp. BDSF3-8]|uniref:hypothetical protein n=1 Tax=Roseivirga sp. BDSF3-8 TaxID=3241598 RepID=UPI003531AC67